MAATDCGSACLSMVLCYFGKVVELAEIRQVLGCTRDGANAQTILEAARVFGLRGRGVRLDIEDVRYLKPGSILHWEFSHFVVFERANRKCVVVLDPALGRRRVPIVQFGHCFTGVALLFGPSEDFAPCKKGRSRNWRYFGQMLRHCGLLARFLATSAILQLLGLVAPIVIGSIVDRVLPRGDRSLLLVLAAGSLSLVSVFVLSAFLRAHLLLHLRTHADAQMTISFIDHLLSLPYTFFKTRQVGDLMTRLASNAMIREVVSSTILSTLVDGLLAGSYLALLLAFDVTLCLWALGLAGLEILVLMLTRTRRKQLISETLDVQSKARNKQVETLAGIETLKAMGAERRSAERLANSVVDELNVALARGRLDAISDSLLAALRLASPLVVTLAGSFGVLSGRLTLGEMLALSALANGFLAPFASLVSACTQFQILDSYVARIEDIFQTAPEQDSKTRQQASLRGRISVDGLCFRYSPQGPPTLHEVSLEIAAGRTLAIVGRSGAGKSTLANLLLGLFLPTCGRIRFDGVDLHSLDLCSLRQQIGIVSQRPHFFDMTIRDNIALGDPTLSMDEIVAAARLAHIHDEICEMPMGYETLIVDGGASFAGGQLQRLALARALVRKPRILLLDEATSSLDSITEGRIHRELDGLGCTRIMIAHRLSTIASADQIVVMANGRVAEKGRHEELLALGGEYAKLVIAQQAGMPREE
ncbi:MAG: peptidase domain-containing ABC transporter [Pseudomonadota bacterium]